MEVPDKVKKFIKSSWTNMNIRCGKYKHSQTVDKCRSYSNIKITFTRNEYKTWCLEEQYTINKLKRPSIDRIDSSKDYSLDNVRVVELIDNIRDKEHKNRYSESNEKRGIRLLSSGKYQSRICIDKKEYNLGSFIKKDDAYQAFYDKYIEVYNKAPW